MCPNAGAANQAPGSRWDDALINRHADDRVGADCVERGDFFEAAKATGCNQPARCSSPQIANDIERNALQQAFGVDVRVKKRVTKSFECAQHIEGGDGGGFLPASDRDVTTTT